MMHGGNLKLIEQYLIQRIAQSIINNPLSYSCYLFRQLQNYHQGDIYEGWNFNSGNYLFTTDTKQIHVSKFYCPSV